jgi:hypothetical protein
MEERRLTLIGICADSACLEPTGDVFKCLWPLTDNEEDIDYINSVPNGDGTKTFLYCPKHHKEYPR